MFVVTHRKRTGNGMDSKITSYTHGMKTAVSIPDDVFEKVERLARRGKRSRSEVFSAALREYVARHSPDEVTEAINRVCDEVGDQADAFVSAATRRILEKTEW
jgi:Arc/MetJ-type ribon-helix-helix transcriptional regulator